MDFTMELKDFILLFTSMGSLMAIYFGLKNKAENNEVKNEETKDSFKSFKEYIHKELEKLELKCNEMMEEKKARETFVTLELYKSEVNHLNKSIDEIKFQTNKILDLLTHNNAQ